MRRNAVANLLGQGWSAAMALAFVPAYLRILGLEAWGLVGFMLTLQAWLALLDLGLSPAMAREAARLTAGQASASAIRNLLRALEAMLIAIAVVVLLFVAGAAAWIVGAWLKPTALSEREVVHAVMLIGVVIAARLVEQLHRSVLQGLSAQVPLNVVLAAMATLRWPGALAVITFVSPTVTAFFAWQAAVSLVTPAIIAAAAYRLLPTAGQRTRFGWDAVIRIRRFIGGVALATTLGIAFAQSDKLLLSGLVPLEAYGRYMFAAAIAGALYFLVAPIVMAAQPRLTALVAGLDHEAVSAAYHAVTQWLAVLIVPPATVLVLLAESVLAGWSGDAVLAAETAPLLRLLAAGTMLNALTNGPTMLLLAHGRTRIPVQMNLAALVAAVPAIGILAPRFGAVAVACVWLVINAAYLPVLLLRVRATTGSTTVRRWAADGVAIVCAVSATIALLVTVAADQLVGPETGRVAQALTPSIAGVASLVGAAIACPAPRAALLHAWRDRGRDDARG